MQRNNSQKNAIQEVSLVARLYIAVATLATCFFTMPYIEQRFNIQPMWGIGGAIGLGIIFFSHLRWFKTTKLLDFFVFMIAFAVLFTSIEMASKSLGLKNQDQQLLLACAGLVIIPLANAFLEYVMHFFE